MNVLSHSVDETSFALALQRALELKEALLGEIDSLEVERCLLLVAELNFQSITGSEDPLKLNISPQLVVQPLLTTPTLLTS